MSSQLIKENVNTGRFCKAPDYIQCQLCYVFRTTCRIIQIVYFHEKLHCKATRYTSILLVVMVAGLHRGCLLGFGGFCLLNVATLGTFITEEVIGRSLSSLDDEDALRGQRGEDCQRVHIYRDPETT